MLLALENTAMHFIIHVTKAFILKQRFVGENQEKCDAGYLLLFLSHPRLQVPPLPLGGCAWILKTSLFQP